MKQFKSFLLTSTVFFVLASGETLLDCGKAKYHPSQYTCYDEDFLCPIIHGISTQRCGDACYSEYMYNCDSRILSPLPAATNPVVLTAYNPDAPFHLQPVVARGLSFYVNSTTCSYCPSMIGQACPRRSNNTTTTSVYPGSSMNALVPGGQQYYIDPISGRLGYTQAHSSSMPPKALQGFVAYLGGEFRYPDSDGFVACPPPESAPTSAWQVFVNLRTVTFADNCIGFTALSRANPLGRVGAWQYC